MVGRVPLVCPLNPRTTEKRREMTTTTNAVLRATGYVVVRPNAMGRILGDQVAGFRCSPKVHPGKEE